MGKEKHRDRIEERYDQRDSANPTENRKRARTTYPPLRPSLTHIPSPPFQNPLDLAQEPSRQPGRLAISVLVFILVFELVDPTAEGIEDVEGRDLGRGFGREGFMRLVEGR